MQVFAIKNIIKNIFISILISIIFLFSFDYRLTIFGTFGTFGNFFYWPIVVMSFIVSLFYNVEWPLKFVNFYILSIAFYWIIVFFGLTFSSI